MKREGNLQELDRVVANPGEWAFFIDIDGTLLDIADTPDGIVVPPGLENGLSAFHSTFDGAVALVTGRSLGYVDRLFRNTRLPVAGLHGAEIRTTDGREHFTAVTTEFEALKTDLLARTKLLPGTVFEDKGAAVAVHYRLAPHHECRIMQIMEDLSRQAGSDFKLQPGKMVIELRPASASKGDAVRKFMNETPFIGRLPVAIGDDVTDEAMFDYVNQRGGMSVKIGNYGSIPGLARYNLASPAQLREWILQFAA